MNDDVLLKLPSESTDGKSTAILVTTLMLGVIAFQVNSSMLSPALPQIAETLNINMGEVSKVSSLFFLSGSIFGLVLSRMSDYFGRKKILILALVLCCTGTIICSMTTNYYLMLFARILQGASSATFQLAYLILHKRLNVRKFGTAIGIITAINGGVGGIDGYFGGLLVDHLGYRSIFLVSCIICGIALLATFLFVPKDISTHCNGKMDWIGAGVLSFCIIMINLAVSSGTSEGWINNTTLIYLSILIFSICVFYKIEIKNSSPLIPLHHFKSRSFWPIIATTVFILAGVFSLIGFAIVIISQNPLSGYGMTPSMSALIYLTPPALMGFISAPITGWLATRLGWLSVLRTGAVLCLFLMVIAASFPTEKLIMFFCLIFLGITYYGVVLTTISGMSVIYSPSEAPSAIPAVNGASYGIGAGLGIGFIANHIGSGTVEGFTHGLWISVIFTSIAVIATFVLKKPSN